MAGTTYFELGLVLMRCEWNNISIFSAFPSSAGVGVVFYRRLSGEVDVSLWMLAAALLLMVIAYLAKRLAGDSAS